MSRFPSYDEAREVFETRATVTVYEAAVILGVGEHTVRRAVQTGELRGVKLGRNVRVASGSVRELLGLDAGVAL